MKNRVLGASIATLALLLTSACGGTDADPVDPGADATDAGVAEEGAETEDAAGAEPEGEATEGEDPEGEATGEAAAGSGEPTVLLGTVGTPEDPEAFEIALTDSSGEPVTELPAGDYVIQVDDPSTLHNFHLTGGSVDETTSVPELEETTFEVTLEPGEYTYVCDPHPSMTGTFTVT